jgi:hypothetical protein
MQSSTKAEAIRKLEALGLKSKAEQTAIRAQQKTEAAAAALHSSADLQAKIEEAQKSYHLKETHDAEGRATGQRRTIAGAEWDHAGHKPGIEVWRIENFHVVGVDPKSYGQFYDGDSYIVLQTRKVEDKFVYDIFFWLERTPLKTRLVPPPTRPSSSTTNSEVFPFNTVKSRVSNRRSS